VCVIGRFVVIHIVISRLYGLWIVSVCYWSFACIFCNLCALFDFLLVPYEAMDIVEGWFLGAMVMVGGWFCGAMVSWSDGNHGAMAIVERW
jgi:hypothetical protein